MINIFFIFLPPLNSIIVKGDEFLELFRDISLNSMNLTKNIDWK